MTPLEEIERTIESTRDQPGFNEVNRAVLLSNLYQARAIERLEATVRHIGVILQARFDPDQSPGARVDGLGLICQYCGKPLGEQHSPHCSRQGKVTVDSTRL